jgi:Rrf2 family protein
MLTKKGKYGLKAMLHLAGTPPNKPVLVSEIAERNAIPKKFLDAILGELRNAGFVVSKKGKGGGYGLARPPADIRVGHIVRALDGPLALIPCASITAYQRCDDCTDEQFCAVRLMMVEVQKAISTVLDQRTLAEMRALSDADQRSLMYFI